MNRVRAFVPIVLVLAVAGCGGEDAVEPVDDGPVDEVLVYFTRNATQEAVRRDIALTTEPLEPAVRALLAGPTDEERRAGFTSHFSDITAGAFMRVQRRADGLALVDLFDFSRYVPAAAAGGGAQLLAELNLTVFQFASIRSVIYRFDGSCIQFWRWLDRQCVTVRRADLN